jgi:hypothetical protein
MALFSKSKFHELMQNCFEQNLNPSTNEQNTIETKATISDTLKESLL